MSHTFGASLCRNAARPSSTSTGRPPNAAATLMLDDALHKMLSKTGDQIPPGARVRPRCVPHVGPLFRNNRLLTLSTPRMFMHRAETRFLRFEPISQAGKAKHNLTLDMFCWGGKMLCWMRAQLRLEGLGGWERRVGGGGRRPHLLRSRRQTHAPRTRGLRAHA